MTLCPICSRPLGEIRLEDHHLIPKTFGGKETICIHGVCHTKIHRTLTNKELFRLGGEAGLLRDVEAWFVYLRRRNQTA